MWKLCRFPSRLLCNRGKVCNNLKLQISHNQIFLHWTCPWRWMISNSCSSISIWQCHCRWMSKTISCHISSTNNKLSLDQWVAFLLLIVAYIRPLKPDSVICQKHHQATKLAQILVLAGLRKVTICVPAAGEILRIQHLEQLFLHTF